MHRSKYLILEVCNGRTKDNHYIYKRPEIGNTINRKSSETFAMFLERIINLMHEKGYNYHSTTESKHFEMGIIFESNDHWPIAVLDE